MGLRRLRPKDLQPHTPRLRAMGQDPRGSRHEGRNPHSQTPRRILPMALRRQRLQREQVALARRQGQRGEGTLRSMQEIRTQVCRIPLALGPLARRLRHTLLSALFLRPAARPPHQLRRGVRGVVRRSQRRRRLLRRSTRQAHHRPQELLQLSTHLPNARQHTAQRRGVRRRRTRLPMGGQREGICRRNQLGVPPQGRGLPGLPQISRTAIRPCRRQPVDSCRVRRVNTSGMVLSS